MTSENAGLPTKSRDIHNHHMNSNLWNNFKFRDDDIILATYAKCGTTWMQQILAQVIFNGTEGIEISKLSPWYDLRVLPPPNASWASNARDQPRDSGRRGAIVQ